MSISVTKIVNLPQAALKFLVQNEIEDEPVLDHETIGGVFSNTDYAWLSNGPRLEIFHAKTGSKVGAWTFGWVLKDSNTEIICIDEIHRPHGRFPLLAVGLDCDFSGGMICIFDCITSKVIRAIQIKDKISNLHVIDSGYDIFTLPGPLRNFDGVIAVGTAGGDVFLIDICRPICDEALTIGGLVEIRDELNPCMLSNITSKDLSKIEFHKEFAIRNSQHLAIHLNIVFDKSTKHFILKGPKGDDRIHVNKEEVAVSALYYCPQLGSLLVGYNFGALQLYNLMNLELVYTSPVCDEHIPISHFAIQEPADDPRAVCYIWAVYSTDEPYPTCLPLAVMYAFCYHTKEYHEGYGYLYQNFSNAAVQYQMELSVPEAYRKAAKLRGGNCLRLKSINQGIINREEPQNESNGDNLTLCVFVWTVWLSKKEKNTFLAVFDLNQWYKEQMPSVQNKQYCSTYMIQIYLNDLINSSTNKSTPILDVHVDENSILQFSGTQRLEEHFYPNSLTFGLRCLRENDIVSLHNYGVQKALLAQIESSGPLCLVEPAEIYQEVIGLGLIPLFIDLPVNSPISTNQQREIILGAALENQLMGWLCKCASEWANGSFLSTGCSLDLLISWAFQRAITLKTNCDKFCVSLFDYSQVRLDNNTNILLNSCTRQLRNLCSLYTFIINKLSMFISNQDLVEEQYKSLETVSVYFEVLQWLLNVGLLPECPLTAYPRTDDLERISAPYPAEKLIEFYNHRRALLKILNEENFSCSESVLFIDALIERECGGLTLQEHWRNDGGNGLYPPPSLQALLRTYLIDNVDLSYKHSVIIYVFLDLAMTLDQDRYKPVITHLIKFPAVFKVSSSVIKITQAFWQLDHSDYNTAMGLLLDPLIASDDLSPWHHKIVLRSLMLQKQHNFALLYVQVRKPVLKDDEDILSAISLYVANNMLDEAFYFEKHFTNQGQGDKFLLHLFNECKKNNKLNSLIYRSFTPDSENFFLKYLASSRESNCEDLLVYFHVLRSHFMEAFESHERTVPNHLANQGLVGQENAIPRDKLIYGLKKILPDVNRNLLSVCRKERINSWQQVSKPTPLSVFVHNLTENVQYKSTIIGAALAKAKQTFNETIKEKSKINSEGTPFLRTPTVSAGSRRSSAVIVNPRVIDVDKDEPDSPPPLKRLKLSRSNASLSVSIPSKLDTPLIQRKTPKRYDDTENNIPTPQSILKVKSLLNHTRSKNDVEFEDNFKEFEKLEYSPISCVAKKPGLGISSRKSLAKSSPIVRFEGLKSSSDSSVNNSRSFLHKSSDLRTINTSTDKAAPPVANFSLVKNVAALSESSKSTSTEEVFYSPETSFEDDKATDAVTEKSIEIKEDSHEKSLTTKSDEVRDEFSEEKQPSPVFSPKARKSYKRSLEQHTPVRSSPRLSRNSMIIEKSTVFSPQKTETQEIVLKNLPKDLTVSSDQTSEDKDEKISVPIEIKTSPHLPKLRPRKSLCRKVLETNTLNKVLNSPLESPRSGRSRKIETSNVEESTEKVVLESTMIYQDGEERHKSSFIKTHNFTTSLLESDVSTSDVNTSEDSNLEYANDSVKPKLSNSMLKYLNRSSMSFVKNSSIKELESESNSFTEESVEREGILKETDNKIDRTYVIDKVSEAVKHESILKQTDINRDKTDVVDKVSEAVEHESILNQTDNKRDTVDVVDKISKAVEHESILNQTDSKMDKIDVIDKVSDEMISPEQDSSRATEQETIMSLENTTFNTTLDNTASTHKRKVLTYSIFDNSKSLLSKSYQGLSDSMVKYLNKMEHEQSQSNEDGEVMEVDDEIQFVEENKAELAESDKSDELVYQNLTSSNSNDEQKVDESQEKGNAEFSDNTNNRPIDPEMNVFEITDDLTYNDGLVDESKGKVNAEFSDNTNNRPIDPEMNVFEITDDLSYNDGLVVEKEVRLEEGDLCYDQQNTLESVLEENIRGVSSTPISVFEKNVFEDSYCSDQESSEYEEQVEPHMEQNQDEENDDVENEVIEIGSSSDEYESRTKEYSHSSNQNSSEYDDDQEIHDVTHTRNIYDSLYEDTSESSRDRQCSEISENSDDEIFSRTRKGCGLFQGDIGYNDDSVEINEEQTQKKSCAEANKTEDQSEKEESEDDENTVDLIKTETNVHTHRDIRQKDGQAKDLYESDEEVSGEMEELNYSIPNEEGVTEKEEILTKEEENISPKGGISDEEVSEQMEELNYSVPNEEGVTETEENLTKEEKNISPKGDIPLEAECTSSQNLPENEENAQQHLETRDLSEDENIHEGLETQNLPENRKSIPDNLETSENDQIRASFEKGDTSMKDSEDMLQKNLPSQDPLEIIDEVPLPIKRVEKGDTKMIESEDIAQKKVTPPDQLDIVDVASLPLDTEKVDTKSNNSKDARPKSVSSPEPLEVVDVALSPDRRRGNVEGEFGQMDEERKPRTRASSVSSSKSDKPNAKTRHQKKINEVPPQKRITEKKVDVSETPKRNINVFESQLETTQSVRTLRSRRVSTDAPTSTPTVSLRKRSASVDEAKPTRKQVTKKDNEVDVITKKNDEVDVKKTRNRRAASVSHLSRIPEENDVVARKGSKSVVEAYSMDRRLTRQQMSLLKKVEGVEHNLSYMDPIILLDRLPFDGKADPEEQKVYDSSPSPSNSASSSPVKASRRLRSASQASDTSQRSKSKTPVRTLTRKRSTDEMSNKSLRSTTSMKKLIEKVETDHDAIPETRTTRRRAKSVTSVNSEDSNASETLKVGKRRQQRVLSQSILPEIKEEAASEKPTIPKKRTRKNSSQT